MVAAALALGVTTAQAACPADAVQECTKDGKPGTRECVGLNWGECEVPPDEVTATAAVQVKFVVLTVVYPLPGSKGGSPSKVTYSTGSSLGSTVTNEQSYADSVSVSFSVGTIVTNLGGGFSSAHEVASKSSTSISKGSSTSIEVGAQTDADGLNPDLALVYFLVGPRVKLNTPPDRFSIDPSGAVVLYATVGELKNPATMRASLRGALNSAGFTSEDYAALKNASVYESPGIAAAADRLKTVETGGALPYEAPLPGGIAQTYSTAVSARGTQTNDAGSSRSYEVKMTGGAGLKDKFGLKLETSMKFTNKRSTSTTTTQDESASVAMRGPSAEYTSHVVAYQPMMDSLYKSFVFVPRTLDDVFAVGRIVGANGRPRVNQPVTLTVAGKRYTTVTSARGNYFFIGKAVSGPLIVRSGTVTKTFASVPASKRLGDMRL